MISATAIGTRYPSKPLGELVEFLDHLRKPVTASERESGPYPYYGANGQQDSVSGYLFDEPLILVAEDGGFFGDPKKTIAYRVDGKCWVNNHAHVLRPRPSVDIGYLCRHLEQYDVRPFTSGTTRLKLNKSQAQRIPIALPPLPVQKRIAAILDAADALRAKRRESIEQLDSLIQSTFLEMFGDPAAGGGIYGTARLGELTEIVMGQSPPGASYNNACSGIALLNGPTEFGSRHPTPIQWTTQPTRMCAPGDLLFCVRGATAGRMNVADSEYCLGRGLAAIRCIDPGANLFLFSILRSMYSYFQAKGVGSTFINISRRELERLEIPNPPNHLQTRFASIVESIEQQKTRLKAHLAELDTLFASLQSRAFNGELVA